MHNKLLFQNPRMARTAGSVLKSRGWVAPKGKKRKVVRKEVSVKDLEDLSIKNGRKKEERRWREWKDVEEVEEVEEEVGEEVEKEVEEGMEEEVEEDVEEQGSKEKRRSSRSSKSVQKFDFGEKHLLKSVKQSNYARKIREKIEHKESQRKYEMKLRLAKLAEKIKEQKRVMVEQAKNLSKKDKCIQKKDKCIQKKDKKILKLKM